MGRHMKARMTASKSHRIAHGGPSLVPVRLQTHCVCVKIALGPVSGLYHRAVHHWTYSCSWLSTPTRRPCLPNAWSCLLLYLTFLKRCMSRTTPGNRMQSGPPLTEDLFLINSHNSGLNVPPITRFAAVLHGEYVCCCFIYPHLFTESLLLHVYLIVVWDTSVIAPQFPL
jgi:hypothetical protein